MNCVARCDACQVVIDAEREAGRIYSAWQQDQSPWHVSFIGPPETKRGSGATLHEAIRVAMKRKE